MFQMPTVSAHTTARDTEVLDSPLWAINFCILKTVSEKKNKTKNPSYFLFSFQMVSTEEK